MIEIAATVEAQNPAWHQSHSTFSSALMLRRNELRVLAQGILKGELSLYH